MAATGSDLLIICPFSVGLSSSNRDIVTLAGTGGKNAVSVVAVVVSSYDMETSAITGGAYVGRVGGLVVSRSAAVTSTGTGGANVGNSVSRMFMIIDWMGNN